MPFINDVQSLLLKFLSRLHCAVSAQAGFPSGLKSYTSGTILSSLSFQIAVLTTFLFFTTFSGTVIAVSTQPVSPLAEIRKIITERALHPPTAESLALLRMDRLNEGLRSIDSHTRYLPPHPSHQKSSMRIGLDVFAYKSRIWVMPEPGGPASQQEIPEVGELRGVNNVRITNNLEQASTTIDNAINANSVMLDIYDMNDGHEKKYAIKPATYKTPSVTTTKTGKNVFIRISDFVSRETAPFFSGLYNTIEKSGSRIILDLRGCPGGDLFEALEIAGMFVPAGLPLITTYDRSGKVHSYTSPAGIKLSSPVCILMDNRTASAAEILAGILKTASITRLVGERSYGKCESQTIFNLSNGGELWLTTLSIHFSDDTSCTLNGVQPDVIYPDVSIARLADIKNVLLKNNLN